MERIIKIATKGAMRIIALYGHANCGKSNTLNRLKMMLRSAGKSISTIPHPWCEQPETFLYKGLVVSVAPAGDDMNTISSNIRYFDSKKCDVAITASRSKGVTVRLLLDLASNIGTDIEWVQKSYEHSLSQSTQGLCNQEMAQLIYDMI